MLRYGISDSEDRILSQGPVQHPMPLHTTHGQHFIAQQATIMLSGSAPGICLATPRPCPATQREQGRIWIRQHNQREARHPDIIVDRTSTAHQPPFRASGDTDLSH